MLDEILVQHVLSLHEHHLTCDHYKFDLRSVNTLRQLLAEDLCEIDVIAECRDHLVLDAGVHLAQSLRLLLLFGELSLSGRVLEDD